MPDPTITRSFEERFWSKVDKTGDCWLWTAGKSDQGYGTFHIGSRTAASRRPVGAHRVAYQLLVGPIPEGFHIDHLCRVRHCVNPAHLEPVTCRVNLLRGETIPADNAAKTHCVHGHPFNAVNTYVTPDGRRQCRTCLGERHRRYRQRKAA